MNRLALLLLAAVPALPCLAQQPAAAPGAADGPPASRRYIEPEVRHQVVEGETVRIDELVVRGQVQRIVVTSRGGERRSYEIITGDGSRDLSDGVVTSRGATGKRVWNVLSF